MTMIQKHYYRVQGNSEVLNDYVRDLKLYARVLKVPSKKVLTPGLVTLRLRLIIDPRDFQIVELFVIVAVGQVMWCGNVLYEMIMLPGMGKTNVHSQGEVNVTLYLALALVHLTNTVGDETPQRSFRATFWSFRDVINRSGLCSGGD